MDSPSAAVRQEDSVEKYNKTMELSDNSLNDAVLHNLEPKRPITRETLHKTHSPGKFQARLTVAGDESYDNSNGSNESGTGHQTREAAEQTKEQFYDSKNEMPGDKTWNGSQSGDRDRIDEHATVANIHNNDVFTPRCQKSSISCDIHTVRCNNQAQVPSTLYETETDTNLSGLTSQSEESKFGGSSKRQLGALKFTDLDKKLHDGERGCSRLAGRTPNNVDSSAELNNSEKQSLKTGSEDYILSDAFFKKNRGDAMAMAMDRDKDKDTVSSSRGGGMSSRSRTNQDGNVSVSATVHSLEIREKLVATSGGAAVDDTSRGDEGSHTPDISNCWQRCFGRRKKTQTINH